MITAVRSIALASALLGLFNAATAGAGGPDDRAQALAAMREGNSLLDKGDSAAALDQFRKAFALVSSPKIHFNFGQALATLPGREAEAYDEFARFLDEAPNADAKTRTEATRQIAFLRPKVGLLTIRTKPDGVTVSLDGQELGTTPFRRPFAALVGTHEVTLLKPGLKAISELVGVTAGSERSAEYVLGPIAPTAVAGLLPSAPTVPAASSAPPIGAAPPAAGRPLLAAPPRAPAFTATPPVSATAPSQEVTPADVTKAGAERSEGAGARVAGLATAGAGVALGITGIFLYRAGAAKLQHIMEAASSKPPGQYNESDGNFQTLGTTGIGLMFVGGAAIAAGSIVYFLNRHDSSSKETHRPDLSVVYVPGAGADIQIGGRF